MSFGRVDKPAAPPASPKLHLVEHVLAGRRFVEITIPHTSPPLVGRLRLLTRRETVELRDGVRAALAQRGITAAAPGVLEGYPEWREETILRTAAAAVRDDSGEPLGQVQDWAELDDVQLLYVWDRYQDLEAELDPLGSRGPALTERDLAEIRAAAKAGDVGRLTSFGSYKLARFATTSVAELQT